MDPRAAGEPPPSLDYAIESEWARLHDQIDLADGFWLGFFFSQTYTAPRVMAERLLLLLPARGGNLRLFRPGSPDDLRSSLEALVGAAREGSSDLLWLEALSSDAPGSDSTWRAAWSEFLARANERREVFVHHHRGGLLLVAPTSIKPLAREQSPDLWAYRSLVIEIGAPPPPMGSMELALAGHASKALSLSLETPPDAPPDTLLARARVALDAGGPRFSSARQVVAAAGALLNADRLEEAHGLLVRLLKLPTDNTPGPFIARAWALLAVIAHRHSDFPAACDHYRQAIRLADFVDVREAIALYWGLSQALFELQDFQGALEESQRAVDLARRLVPDPLFYLFALVGSLEMVFLSSRRLGDLKRAESAIVEALELRRHLVALRGNSPEELQFLRVELGLLADLLKAKGDLEGAEAAAAEAEGLRLRLEELQGKAPDGG